MADKYDAFLDSKEEGTVDKYDHYLESGPGVSYSTTARDKDPLYPIVETLPTIGSVAGGIGGAITSGPIGSLLGTGAGASIGTSLQQLYDFFQGYDSSTEERLKQQASNIGEQVAYDALGQGVGRAVGRGVGYFTKPKVPGIEEYAVATQNMLKRRGATLTAGQVSTNPKIRWLQSMADQGLTGGLGKTYQAQEEALSDILKDMLQKNQLSRSQVGELVVDISKRGDKALQLVSGELYKQLDILAGEKGGSKIGQYLGSRGYVVPWSTPPVSVGQATPVSLDAAKNYVKQVTDDAASGLTQEGLTFLKGFLSLDNAVTFSKAHEQRSLILAKLRDLEGKDSILRRHLVKLAGTKDMPGLLTGAMEEGAKKIDDTGDFYKMYRSAENLYRTSKEKLSNDVMASLLRLGEGAPERIGEKIWMAGNTTPWHKLRAAAIRANSLEKQAGGKGFDVKEKLDQVRQGYIAAILRGSPDEAIDAVKHGEQLRNKINDPKVKETMDTVLSPTQAAKVREFIHAAYLVGNKPQPGKLGILFPLVQAAALGSIGTAVTMGADSKVGAAGAGLVLLSPYVVSKVLGNPKYVDYMIRTIKGGKTPYSPQFVAKVEFEIAKAMQEEEKLQEED